MSQSTWMIYGATGVMGTLIAEESVRRGHRPLLVGRSTGRLAFLGERLDLPWKTIGLDEPDLLEDAISNVAVVLNAAGPFVATAPPLIQACLSAGAHYLDIANEIPVLQSLFAQGETARKQKVALIGGIGFGVVASSSLVKYVADLLPGATRLEFAVKADNRQSSQGALKSTLEVLAGGGYVYRNGRLTRVRLGRGMRKLRFPGGALDLLPVPSGDLEAAYRTTRIPNITAFIPFQKAAALLLPLAQMGLSLRPIRRWLEAGIDARQSRERNSQSDGEKTSYAWARVEDQNHQAVEAWLEMGEGYNFTAASSVRAVERVLANSPSGALTPAQAFGADFILEIEGVRRLLNPPHLTFAFPE